MENYWADVISIQLASDTTALTDLSHGTELWFWVDASAFRSSDLMLELKIGGQTPAIGGSYYKIINGEKIADTLPASYNGADYARIPLGQAYRGWIGVSLDAFGTVSSADVISLYIEPWGDKDSGTLPQSLYLDAFCLVESPYETIWNMENLPEGPLDSSWVSGQGLDAGVVEMRGTAAKGNNGSRALEYHFNTSGGDAYWANGVTIIPSNDASFQSDWSSGDTLWFWLDAHEIDCDILLELTVNSVAPLAGQPFYTLAGGIKTLKTLAPAWEGQTNARIPVAGGYTGWIGLPLSAFAEPISEVRQLQLYTQPWAGDIPAADMPVDKSLYFDDLSSYTRSFTWSPSHGKRLFLCFEGIAYEGILYLNGKKLGEMLPYSEYRFEITQQVLPGENQIRLDCCFTVSQLKICNSLKLFYFPLYNSI